MKIVGVGSTYRIYDDDLKTFDALPVQTYALRFDKMSGFYLEVHSDFEIAEKTYGVHTDKVAKVFSSFAAFDRNLGVILSGKKGIGKSLFAKMIAESAIKNGIPVIIADRYIPGIAAYLESIEQEVVVLFDEFDKTFGEADQREGTRLNPQTEMLTLFDGITNGRKLFVITCNELRNLNDYLVNRPGRFHYHFRFDYPTAGEIREYLTDKLDEKYYGEIDRVISFASRVDVNYDCLRAIAFELNTGASFEVAIGDLNIINTRAETYRVVAHFDDHTNLEDSCVNIDMFNKDAEHDFWLGNKINEYVARAKFSIADCIYDATRGCTFIDPENVKLIFDDEPSGDKEKLEVERFKAKKLLGLTFHKKRDRSIHYGMVC